MLIYFIEKKVEDEDKKVDANPIKEAEGNTLVAANVGAKVAEEAVDNHESKVENSDQVIAEAKPDSLFEVFSIILLLF